MGEAVNDVGQSGLDRDPDAFDVFVATVEPRLRAALAGRFGPDGTPDAVAEALAYAWEHWSAVRGVENPVGYLYRVAQSKSRTRRQGHLPQPGEIGLPDVDPAVVPALASLPEMQRTAVWLVVACGWTHPEAGLAMGVSSSTVSTHVSRGLKQLRSRLGVDSDVR